LDRNGTAAKNHSTSSNTIEQILDWRPFDYFTVRYTKDFLKFTVTHELKLLKKGTDLSWRLHTESGLLRMITRFISRFFANQVFRMNRGFEKMETLTAASEFNRINPEDYKPEKA
jgi:hypothetical protein